MSQSASRDNVTSQMQHMKERDNIIKSEEAKIGQG